MNPRRFRLAVLCLLMLVPGLALGQPRADHHQHLFSPALAELIKTTPITAADLIKHLDDAGIRRAVVLSTAYSFSNPARKVQNDHHFVRADNDWTAAQVALYPERLIGFCAVNPLKDYALAELARCAKNPQLLHGLKLHFGNSFVEYHNKEHIAQVRRVFRAANDLGMAIVVHLRANTSQKMGRDEALVFLNELLPAAPDVIVQIAHMAGAGGMEPSVFGEVLDVFVDAIGKRDPRVKNVWFEVSAITTDMRPDTVTRMAERIRQVGVDRVLFGSDAASIPDRVPRNAWATFRKLPLTDAEFRTIENNVAPYLR